MVGSFKAKPKTDNSVLEYKATHSYTSEDNIVMSIMSVVKWVYKQETNMKNTFVQPKSCYMSDKKYCIR